MHRSVYKQFIFQNTSNLPNIYYIFKYRHLYFQNAIHFLEKQYLSILKLATSVNIEFVVLLFKLVPDLVVWLDWFYWIIIDNYYKDKRACNIANQKPYIWINQYSIKRNMPWGNCNISYIVYEHNETHICQIHKGRGCVSKCFFFMSLSQLDGLSIFRRGLPEYKGCQGCLFLKHVKPN